MNLSKLITSGCQLQPHYCTSYFHNQRTGVNQYVCPMVSSVPFDLTDTACVLETSYACIATSEALSLPLAATTAGAEDFSSFNLSVSQSRH